MTSNENLLALQLVKEHYGPLARSLVALLLEKKTLALGFLVDALQVEAKLVAHILATLIAHSLVEYQLAPAPRQMVEYRFNTQRALKRLKIAKYVQAVRQAPHALAAQQLLTQLLLHGCLEMSCLLLKLLPRGAQQSPPVEAAATEGSTAYAALRDAFLWLAERGYVERCAMLDAPIPPPPAFNAMEIETTAKTPLPPPPAHKIPQFLAREQHGDSGSVPELRIDEARKRWALEQADGETVAFQLRKSNETFGDAGVYWRVNHRRFFQEARDAGLCEAMNNRIDAQAASILAAVLRLVDAQVVSEKATSGSFLSKAVTAIDIQRAMRNEHQMDPATVDKYISVITQDSFKILEKLGDFSGGTYYVDFKRASHHLCIAHIESYVKERYGSKSLRIFKVILDKQQLEQKQIEDFSMIPSKECKALLYTMLNDGLLSISELSKTTDHAPSRTYYLFHIDVNLIARQLFDHAAKAMLNLMLKREHLGAENRRLLAKHKRIAAIADTVAAAGADQAEIDEVRAMMSSEDVHQLRSVTAYCDKVELAEIELEETMFILENYFYYHTVAPQLPVKK